jgi:hypothetical protein
MDNVQKRNNYVHYIVLHIYNPYNIGVQLHNIYSFSLHLKENRKSPLQIPSNEKCRGK